MWAIHVHQGDYRIEPKECAISTSRAITFGIGTTGIQGVTGEEIILISMPANKINLKTFFPITPKVSPNVYQQEEGLHNMFIVQTAFDQAEDVLRPPRSSPQDYCRAGS